MFGRFGWAEILVIVVLVLILFGHNKIPGMMKNLADGLNVFKREIKNNKSGKNAKEKSEKDAKKPVKAGAHPTKKIAKKTAMKK